MKVCIAVFLIWMLATCVTSARADDLVKQETRVADAVAKYGVTGNGVIVAVMDRGIDWQNNDFRNSDGSTRIAYIFDLTDDSGATAVGNPYGMGTIYTRSQINTGLINGTTLPTRDAVGHGTATAGNCCGNGRNSANGKYSGIAPQSTLIVVKLVSDGAPAHDGEPAEAPFFQADRIPIGINFVRDKATELGIPCVMILNIGSTGGPADGTSSLARKIDTTVGPGKPGLIFVTGTGDDGGMPNHAGGIVAQGGLANIQIQKGNALPLRFEMWYQDTDRFDVSIDTPTATYGPFTAPTNSSFDTRTTPEFQYFHNGSIFYTNHKRVVYFDLTGPAGNYTVRIFGAQVASGAFDADLNPSRFWDPNYSNNRFLSHVVPGKTIWDMATALYNIVPNSYVFRTSWIDIDGFTRSKTGEGAIGDLWLGSSVGPTWDGRSGVDVSASAESIITTYNPRSWWATSRFNLIQDGGGLYGMASAVSAANPLVTGIIALMLEKNPNLDAAVVKSIVQSTARRDAFTGPSPDPKWGYGKIDALAALDSVAATLSNPTSVSAAVLPSSRSVQVGVPATAFVAIANAPGNTAVRCSVSPASNIAAEFSFQTTDPSTNAVTGTVNMPVDIVPGGLQTFVISFLPTAAFAPTDALFTFVCLNSAKSPTYVGVNTLLLSASSTPVPDVIALAATTTNDGIVNVPGTNGTGVFAVATVNVGASGSIRASADTGSATLPVNISLCQTHPATAQCISAIAPSVTTQINSNATPTFGIFVQGNGNVPFDPAANRIFVRFKDGGNVTRGSTSVAVRTQ